MREYPVRICEGSGAQIPPFHSKFGCIDDAGVSSGPVTTVGLPTVSRCFQKSKVPVLSMEKDETLFHNTPY